jgi:GNAT superfamily N-acetyltransferase
VLPGGARQAQFVGQGRPSSSTVLVVISVVRDSPDVWTALRGVEVVGRLQALLRPDQRCFLFLRADLDDAYARLLDTALPVLGQEVYADVDQDAVTVQALLAERGFMVSRREHRYLVPTDLAPAAHRPMPQGLEAVSVLHVDADRWRELDDTLRQEVPGAAGWRNDPAEFARSVFDDPQFDPALYLLAVERGSGDYVGLVRVWNRAPVPRLGLIATLPGWRRRGLALWLLTEAFGVLHQRGQHEVECEVDETNTASNSLMTRLGARRVGGNVELVRRERSRRRRAGAHTSLISATTSPSGSVHRSPRRI